MQTLLAEKNFHERERESERCEKGFRRAVFWVSNRGFDLGIWLQVLCLIQISFSKVLTRKFEVWMKIVSFPCPMHQNKTEDWIKKRVNVTHLIWRKEWKLHFWKCWRNLFIPFIILIVVVIQTLFSYLWPSSLCVGLELLRFI